MPEYTYQKQLRRQTTNAPNYGNGASAAQRYAVDGHTPPAGIVGTEAVKEMQRWLGGLTVDGIWGPKTQKRYDKFLVATLNNQEAPAVPADVERLGYL